MLNHYVRAFNNKTGVKKFIANVGPYDEAYTAADNLRVLLQDGWVEIENINPYTNNTAIVYRVEFSNGFITKEEQL